MKKRILSLVLACIMLFGMLPAYAVDGAGDDAPAAVSATTQETEALSSTTVSVDFTAQMENGFLLAPQFNVSVEADLAERYGYTDNVTGSVSALDVLVKAHELDFGEAFTAENKNEYLKLSSTGFISKLFSVETPANGFVLNGGYPNDGMQSSTGSGYNGTTVTTQAVEDGDRLEFFIYQDTSTYADKLAWFCQGGVATDTITARPSAEVTLSVQSIAYSAGYLYRDAAALRAAGSPTAGAQLAWVGTENGALTDIQDAVTGEDGKAAFTAPTEEGTYYLTAYMPAADIEDGATPLVMSLVKVVVDQNAPQPEAPSASADLAALSVADLDSNPNPMTMTPAFSREVTEYSVAPVNFQQYAKMAYVKAAAASETATIKAALNGTEKDVTSGDTVWTAFNNMQPGQDNVLTVTVTNGDLSKVYTVTIPMKAETIAVTGISLDKTELTLTAGGTAALTATVAPDNATDKTVTWTSSNTVVATVENGTVTAAAAGTATITAQAGGKTAECAVTVEASSYEVTLPSDWPSFRGNAQNNGVTNALTPVAADSTELLWAQKHNTGWSDAPSQMILVDGDVISMYGNTLKKLNASDGSVKASVTMDTATSYGTVPPTYGDGIIFCPLGGGKVQAFSAKTLESLWVYTDEKGGQAQSPIAYSDGKVYVGFGYNDQGTGSCSFVCLNAKDGERVWWDVDGYGYYWGGAVVVGNYVIYGTNGGKLVSRDKRTGEVKMELDCSACGKIRSSICYAEGKVWFGGYSAKLGWATLNENGTLGELNTVDLSSYGSNSTSTPVVYNGLVYLGVGGGSEKNSVVCVDSATKEVKWSVAEPAYPQCSILLSTAYESTGYLYLYVTYNNNPGGVNVIKAKADGSSATQETLYTPASDAQNYCICSVIAAADGKIYYKNDSGNIFALKNTASVPATIPVTLSGLHNMQVSSLKLYTYVNGQKGTTDLLANITASGGEYKVNLPAGDYWVEGYDANNDLNGGLKLTVSEESKSFKFQRMYQIYATNSGWVKGTDYTIDVTVTDANGHARTIALGQANNYGTMRTSCLFVVGDSVEAVFTPIGDKAANYLPTTAKKTPTMNDNLTASIPQSYAITITAPAGSTIAAGTFATYYIYTFAESTVTEDESGVTAVFRVPQTSGYHFYRVQHPNGVTYWNFAKWNAATTIHVTAEDLNLNSATFKKDTVSRFDKNVYDMANIYLNANGKGYLDLDVGERFELNVFRNWMAIESFMNAKVGLPDMHYTVIDPAGNPSDVLTITPDANNSSVATMTANKAGTAIVLVTYDAMTHVSGQGGKEFSAIWPECTGVVVVTVGADGSSIKTNMMMDRLDAATTALDAEHDILFYLGSEGASYSFKPEEGCTVTVNRSVVTDKMTFGGFTGEGVTVAEDGTVTVSGLTTGRHIIKVEKGDVANYQVVTARGVSYVLQDKDGNALAEGAEIRAGDTIKLQFTGLISPAEKLSGVYNHNFSLYYFGEDDVSFRSNPGGSYGVYDFSGNPVRQNITITIPKYWNGNTYTLHGAIKLGGFKAAPIGGHRDVRYATGKPMSHDATDAGMVLSRLPELTINLAATAFVGGKLTFVDSNSNLVARTALTVNLTDSEGNRIIVADDGSFPCVAGEYTYTIYGAGYRYKTGSFSVAEGVTEAPVSIELVNSSVSAWDGVTVTEPAKEGDVYLIDTGAKLAWLSKQVAEKAFTTFSAKLTGDIDLGDYPWTAINTSSFSYVFTLDGANHEIRGLNAAKGLFGTVGGASEIKDLTVSGVLNTANGSVGSIVGYLQSGKIQNCVSKVAVTATGSSNNSIGGIAGYMGNAKIINCVNKGAITAEGSQVGGIVGAMVNNAAEVSGCYNTGAVSAASEVGGILGSSSYTGTVSNCYNTGTITGTGANVGGVIGESAGSASSCYNVGTVTGGKGFAGSVGNADKCYALSEDDAAEVLDETAMKSADLGDGFKLICDGYPALAWQTGVTAHAAAAEAQSVTVPTCTEKGYKTYLCTLCRESFRKDYTAPLGHDFCEHEGVPEDCTDCVYTAPDCETEGSIVHTCRREDCDVTKTDVIPAIGHTLRGDPIQTFPAYKTYACSVCEQENIIVWNDPRLAHMTLPAANASDITMSDSGDYPWTWNSTDGRLQSSSVGVNSSTSTSAIAFTLNHGGTLKFDYAVSSESNYDKLTIKLGEDPLVDAISGNVNGSVDKPLAAGTYTLTMSFAKDSSGASGSDMGWISGVAITAFSEEEAAAANRAAAGRVIAAIEAIGEVKLEKEQDIKDARAAYNALTDAQKALVTNEGVLTAAEAKLANLKNPSTKPNPNANKITVSFRLIGAEKAEKEVDMSESDYAPAYVTWIKTKSYTLDKNATVGELFALALDRAGLTYEGLEGDYISSITAPSACGGYALAEMTNGNSSGWMYTVNGSHPNRGLNHWTLFNGDEVVWHYVNDHRYEVEDWFGGSSGNENTWNKWLDALDVNPTSGGSTSAPTKKPSASKSSTLAPEVTATKGEAKAEVSEKNVSDAITAAKKDGAAAIVIAPVVKGDANKVSVELPRSAAQNIVSGTDAALNVQTAVGALNIPNDTLAEIVKAAGTANISMSVEKADGAAVKKKLPETAKVDGAVAVEFKITSGSKTISSFGGKSLEASVPVSSKDYTNGKSYVAFIISDDGTVEKTVAVIKNGAAVLLTRHFSTVVVTKEEIVAFTDVATGEYYYDAVLWAVARGITNGTSASTFSPNASCTRAQMVTFLWRAAGSPEPSGKTNPFADVEETAYYFKALLWAVENGITDGTSTKTFSPDMTCTRAQMAAFLWRNAKRPAASGTSAFTDVKAGEYYSDAVVWLAQQGITDGTTKTTFSPDATCTRGQMVTFLYRYLAD